MGKIRQILSNSVCNASCIPLFACCSGGKNLTAQFGCRVNYSDLKRWKSCRKCALLALPLHAAVEASNATSGGTEQVAEPSNVGSVVGGVDVQLVPIQQATLVRRSGKAGTASPARSRHWRAPSSRGARPWPRGHYQTLALQTLLPPALRVD